MSDSIHVHMCMRASEACHVVAACLSTLSLRINAYHWMLLTSRPVLRLRMHMCLQHMWHIDLLLQCLLTKVMTLCRPQTLLVSTLVHVTIDASGTLQSHTCTKNRFHVYSSAKQRSSHAHGPPHFCDDLSTWSSRGCSVDMSDDRRRVSAFGTVASSW